MRGGRRRWLAGGGLAAVIVVAVVLVSRSGSGHPGRAPVSPTTVSSSGTTTSSTVATSTTLSSTTTPAVTLAPARPAPPGEHFGASVNLLFNAGTVPPPQIAAQLQALRATGATIARSDALWEASEPSPPVNGVHTFAWTFDDTIAGDLAAHHLRWEPILGYSAPWAVSIPGQDHSPPASDADYAAYAGAFATRYGPGGTFWREHPALTAEPVETYEIWNEPDLGIFWTPAPDAARYADLYIAARVAIDAAQPDARVIVGGLTQPTNFIPELLAARPQLNGHIDGFAIHPYGRPLVVLDKIRADRETLTSLGMGSVPLYVTEFGWTTTPPGALNYVPAAQRPDYISQVVTALGHLDCGLATAIIYTWFSPGGDPTNSEDWFGIDSPSGAPTADSAAFTRALRRDRGAAATLPLCR